MDPVTIALLANAALDLALRLVDEYTKDPSVDPEELAKLHARLDATVKLVTSKRPIPGPDA